FVILHLLTRLGAKVAYHDPFVSEAPHMRHFPEFEGLESVPLSEASLRAQDAVVLVTHHSRVDYELVGRHAALIVDTRGVFREPAANVVRA
ncbi:MAG TPA: UDP binding domain-containing protein, partial [Thermoanaerobaculia bacterium]|nr:UDP binding domain-containing protein [Thermoanaerobaculia bacterium]